jgi:hypothetical protein
VGSWHPRWVGRRGRRTPYWGTYGWRRAAKTGTPRACVGGVEPGAGLVGLLGKESGSGRAAVEDAHAPSFVGFGAAKPTEPSGATRARHHRIQQDAGHPRRRCGRGPVHPDRDRGIAAPASAAAALPVRLVDPRGLRPQHPPLAASGPGRRAAAPAGRDPPAGVSALRAGPYRDRRLGAARRSVHPRLRRRRRLPGAAHRQDHYHPAAALLLGGGRGDRDPRGG